MIERDLQLGDRRTLHVYDTGPAEGGRFPVVWHHGTPNLGSPPAPLFAAADRLGLRWVSFDRPGYGWGWLGEVARPALDTGPYGQIDDDVSYTLP